MLQPDFERSSKRLPVLLAGGFLVLSAAIFHAQTNQTGQPVANPGSSAATDPARIRRDEARLLAILDTNPDDPGALAGMGWVRSRQKNYTAAISYLERARRKRPADPKLAFALDEARFRVLLAEAQQALASGQAESAQKFYSGALTIRPRSREAFEGVRTAAARTVAENPTVVLLTDLIQ